MNYTSQWKLRLLYELADWSDATFLTLNYSDDWFQYLAEQGRYDEVNNLSKKEVSAYIKRLRRRIFYRTGRDIKSYTVGEYGERRGRAHYHAIIFGASCYDDEDADDMKFAWNQKSLPVARNEDFQWDKSRGRKCAIQPVTPDDIAYVTGYVQKKLTGRKGKEVYGNRTPPFALMSKGLGLANAVKNRSALSKGWTYLPGGSRVGIPRYFREKLDIDVKVKPNVEFLNAEFDWLRTEFEKKNPRPQTDNLNSFEWRSWFRRYEWFCDDRSWAIADQCWKDFEQRSKLKGGVF